MASQHKRTLSGTVEIYADIVDLPNTINAVRINGDKGSAGQVIKKDSSTNKIEWADEDDNETYLEDILIESNNGKDESHFDLKMSVTIKEMFYDEDDYAMFIIKSEHEDTNNEVACSASLDNEFANESI